MEPSEKFDIEREVAKSREERESVREREKERLLQARALYSDDQGQPMLRPSFAVYIDRLGTKNAVRDLDDAELRLQISLLDRFRWFLHDVEWGEDERQKLISFTDNVILGVPLDSSSIGAHGLGFLVSSIAGYQVNMTLNGAFLRGAVARGPLYIDDRFSTGGALVDAVVLEEQFAVSPRIVLSESCVGLMLIDIANDYGGVAIDTPWDSQLLVDGDSRVFVNYLIAIDDGHDDARLDNILSGLDRHQTHIDEQLKQFEQPGRIRDKYVWAAQYHGFVCEEFFSDLDIEPLLCKELSPVERLIPRSFQRLHDYLDVEAAPGS